MQKGLDFPDFYAAANDSTDGRDRELYDPLVQNQYLIRYSGRVGTYFIHPAFETLIYFPFAMLPLHGAYTLWSVFQAIQLIVISTLLRKTVLRQVSWRFLIVIFLLFASACWTFWRPRFAFASAAADAGFRAVGTASILCRRLPMGCGLFKFHLVVPAIIPCIFGKRKLLLWGFASTTLALLIVSVWISGFGAITAYTRFLLQLNSLPMAGIHDAQKANLRGLFGLLLPGYQHTASYLSLLSSVLVMYLAVRSSLLAREDVRSARLAFANAVFAAVLVGYHLSPHDLTILLLPMFCG